MLKGLYTAWSGMVNEQNRMDVMTNNLANATTTGYKKEGTTSQSFDTVLAYRINDLSTGMNVSTRIGSNSPGVKIGENYVDHSQGSFKSTGNTFDLAIGGEGFFNVEFTSKSGEKSVKYTRDGNFTLNVDGYMVTQDGDYVLGDDNQYIKLNTALDATIDENGNIWQEGNLVAKVKLTDFEDYDYLVRYGENYFEAIEGATPTATRATVNSGYLEQSNISVVTEMVNMITISRAYETNQKVVQTYDRVLDTTVNQIGRLG